MTPDQIKTKYEGDMQYTDFANGKTRYNKIKYTGNN